MVSNIQQCIELLNIQHYKINDGNSVTVDGDVILAEKGLSILPFKFKEVFGNFDVSYNALTSMKNFPDFVEGGFRANNNNFTIFDWQAPVVIGVIDFSDNKITSFKGFNLKETNSLNVSYNLLTSLSGCPKTINGYFWITHNKLQNLSDGPEIVEDDYDITYNDLKDLTGIENTEIGRRLYARVGNNINFGVDVGGCIC